MFHQERAPTRKTPLKNKNSWIEKEKKNEGGKTPGRQGLRARGVYVCVRVPLGFASGGWFPWPCCPLSHRILLFRRHPLFLLRLRELRALGARVRNARLELYGDKPLRVSWMDAVHGTREKRCEITP